MNNAYDLTTRRTPSTSELANQLCGELRRLREPVGVGGLAELCGVPGLYAKAALRVLEGKGLAFRTPAGAWFGAGRCACQPDERLERVGVKPS